MSIKKLLTIAVVAGTMMLSSLTVCAAGRSLATGLIDLDKQVIMDCKTIMTGEVIQLNVGSKGGQVGYRFYLDRDHFGKESGLIKEVTLTYDATISGLGYNDVYKSGKLYDDYKDYYPCNWECVGFASDGYVEFYANWAYEHSYKCKHKDDDKRDAHDYDEHRWSQWYVTTVSDLKNPGVQTRICRDAWCGHDDHMTALTYDVYVGDINRQIKYAATGAVIECANPTYNEIAGSLMNELALRPDVKVIQTYKDSTGKHVRQISAAGITPIS